MALNILYNLFNRNQELSLTQECLGLQKLYADRQSRFEDWYSLLRLDDKLAQTDMESFVGNDPRTTWNMAVYLLQPKPLVVSIETSDGRILTPETADTAKQISQYFNAQWRNIDRQELYR